MYKVKVIDKSAIIAAVVLGFLIVSQVVRAEEYQFNSTGSPTVSDEKSKFMFKAKSPEEKEVNSTVSEQVFHSYVDYPRFQFEMDYGPSSIGLKQEYNNLPLNFSSTSYSGVSLKGRYLVSPDFNVEADYRHAEFKVASKDLGLYKVSESKTSIDAIMLRFNSCKILQSAMDSICYGVTTGIDSYPTLNFETSTQLAISKIKDMVIGLNLNYRKEIVPYIQFDSSAEYLYGLRLGQDTNLGVDNNSKLQASLGLNFLSQKSLNYFSVSSAYSYQEAKVHGSTGSFVDSWSTKASEVSVNVSYTWTFEGQR
ncbi:MAG: hypothetical protein H7235_01060 [Bdellovibrionaceae bacterium]|nr:hypothetical protein [Pseudobdellovibrionaceae bacterium]